MAIQSGTHLGPYEILSTMGAGGMDEVYCARDPQLGRNVAIKVLPDQSNPWPRRPSCGHLELAHLARIRGKTRLFSRLGLFAMVDPQGNRLEH